MAGRPGRSGGANKLTPEELLRRGTWRVYRHGPRPASLALAAARVETGSKSDPVSIPPALVEGLTGRGLAFVRDCWHRYSGWAPASLALLRETGFTINAVEQLRGERGERQAQRTLLALLAALSLEK